MLPVCFLPDSCSGTSGGYGGQTYSSRPHTRGTGTGGAGGFWTGAATGGLLGYLFGSRTNTGYHSPHYRSPRSGWGTGFGGGWNTGWGGGGSSWGSSRSSGWGGGGGMTSTGTRTASGLGCVLSGKNLGQLRAGFI